LSRIASGAALNLPLIVPWIFGSTTAVVPCDAASSRSRSGSGFSLATIWNGRPRHGSSAAPAA